MITYTARNFHLAYQIGYFDAQKIIDDIISQNKIYSDELISLLKISLLNYFAAALLMPYDDFLENIDDLVWTQDEPFGGLSGLMQYLLFKKVNKEGYKVILDGQGADEIMMGYNKYFPFFRILFI